MSASPLRLRCACVLACVRPKHLALTSVEQPSATAPVDGPDRQLIADYDDVSQPSASQVCMRACLTACVRTCPFSTWQCALQSISQALRLWKDQIGSSSRTETTSANLLPPRCACVLACMHACVHLKHLAMCLAERRWALHLWRGQIGSLSQTMTTSASLLPPRWVRVCVLAGMSACQAPALCSAEQCRGNGDSSLQTDDISQPSASHALV